MARGILDIIFRTKKEGQGAKELQRELKGVNTALSSLGIAAPLTGAALAGMAVAGLKKAVDEAAEAQQVMAQTQAVIRSTGGAAGITAREVAALSASFSQQTTFAHEEVQAMQNVLLTFTALGKDILPEATSVVLDMSTALGLDLQQAAIQVGKALQDPILGVTALRRVGVNFNAEQTKLIKNLVETGRAAEAQALIMKELNAEFGGSAAAQVNTYAGSVKRLGNAWDELWEAAGTPLLGPLTRDMNVLTSVLTGQITITDVATEAFGRMWRGIEGLPPVIDTTTRSLSNIPPAAGEAGVALEGVGLAIDSLPTFKQFTYKMGMALDDDMQEVMRLMGWSTAQAFQFFLRGGMSFTAQGAAAAGLGGSTPGFVQQAAAANAAAIATGVKTSGRGGAQQAEGGKLGLGGSVAEVGEEGTEGVIRTKDGWYVVPHDQWEAMKAAGLVDVGQHLRVGGEAEEGFGAGTVAGSAYYPGRTSSGGLLVGGGGYFPGYTSSGGELAIGGQASPSFLNGAALSIAAEAASQAAASSSMAIAGQIPAAVAAETRTQNQIMVRSQEQIVLELRALKQELARVVRDAVAQI